jgi:CRISPR system Cascade subunit CasA
VPDQNNLSFNLWQDSWIGVEDADRKVTHLGIREVLVQAHRLNGLYDPSPLAIVGIHRLLVAILQDIIHPGRDADLKRLWQAGAFSQESIDAFGGSYADRFDLFSDQMPFLQSGDIPLKSDKNAKSVAYLAADIPAGTEVIHFRHSVENDHGFCPACCARGLVTIPAFATSGGAGIRPSINGVPPLYILPGGKSLFESLAASLIRPDFFPGVAAKTRDDVWWRREPIVNRSQEVLDVGYLHSLTFPARRVRLHPEARRMYCTRCGKVSEWVVRQIVFEMGEQRPKTAPFWFDPFASYRISDEKPRPIRPEEGKAAWREFSALFLQQPIEKTGKTQARRPVVLDQIAALEMDLDQSSYPFRAIGLRTDMKAKIFEWVDTGFEIPPAILLDSNAGLEVQQAVDFATDCGKILASTFRQHFGGSSKKYERNKPIRVQMDAEYWDTLANPFRQFILLLASPGGIAEAQPQWGDWVVRAAKICFLRVLDALDDNAETLRQRAMAEKSCNIDLSKRRKAYLHE